MRYRHPSRLSLADTSSLLLYEEQDHERYHDPRALAGIAASPVSVKDGTHGRFSRHQASLSPIKDLSVQLARLTTIISMK